MHHVVVGTAGHIDHGKSTLIHRLTGIDPDRLKEEKARGITIELGFADLELGSGRVASFVDVPGHERFVRHMVAGASGIDAVMMVVAADAGVQPQTREHLDICRLLDVRHGIVVLTKTDLVDAELSEVVELEVREALHGTFLESAPLLSVSARRGDGLDRLREALVSLVDSISPRPSGGIGRLPVDRSFVLRGFGTVVTGTLASGSIVDGQELEILPGGRTARVRGLQVHRHEVDRVRAGQRVAVNLQGVSTEDVPRGVTLVHPGTALTTRRVWARVQWLDHAPEALRRGGRVRLHCGTSECGARLRGIGAGDEGAVDCEVFLDRQSLLVPADRFILRQTAPLDTVGGGVVIDAFPPRGRAARAEIHELARATPGKAVALRVARSGRVGATGGELAVEMGLAVDAIDRTLRELERAGRVVVLAGRWFDRGRVDELDRAIEAALERFHRDEPLRSGMPREQLRAEVCPEIKVETWRVWLDRLAEDGRVRKAGDRLASASHEVLLSPGESQRLEAIEKRFEEAGLEPPDVAGVVRENEELGTRLIEILEERGVLVRIRDGRLFHRDALEGLYERLREFRKRSPTIDVAGFKELFGVTRKNAIPLLEHLDGERRTKRVGNLREILIE